MNTAVIFSIIGWVGAVAVLYAYLMLSSGKMLPDSLKYQGFNLIGAFCLIVNTAYNEAYPSTVVNIIWVFVGIYALSRFYLKKNTVPIDSQKIIPRPVRVRKVSRFRKRRA
ncbi:MAG: hypothetical protein WD048_10730 [Chitinophagales bacterium]